MKFKKKEIVVIKVNEILKKNIHIFNIYMC